MRNGSEPSTACSASAWNSKRRNGSLYYALNDPDRVQHLQASGRALLVCGPILSWPMRGSLEVTVPPKYCYGKRTAMSAPLHLGPRASSPPQLGAFALKELCAAVVAPL